ncbi:MAG: hypothetical protein U0451_00235 [Candidatus Saccharimonadales bacterium]
MSEQKETIYIDIDDEITGIIDKVTTSKKKIVALVLPKRATVMQSIVNMRLLKRASDDAGKNIVLITSDASVLPLAGVAGVYIAKTLQSKPYLPDINQEDFQSDEAVEEVHESYGDKKKLAGIAGAAAIISDDDEAIEVDNETAEPSKDKKPSKTAGSEKKNKKLKVPNFDSFRTKLLVGIGVFLIVVVAWIILFKVMPKATITVKTNATTAPIDITFAADVGVDDVDVQNKVVPAKVQDTEKTKVEKAPTTGEKNMGEKATGTVKMQITTNCVTLPSSVPSGTTISSSGFNFVTQKEAVFDISNPDFQNGKCIFSTNSAPVIATEGGGKYNLSARTYTVSGFNAVVGNGSNMTGGTDKIIKTVSQSDIDSAKAKALESNLDEVKAEMSKSLEDEGYIPLLETFGNSEPVVTSAPSVGAESNEVTVTVVTKYHMTGAKQDGVKKIIDEEAKQKIDTNNQSISDYGLDNAVYHVSATKPDGSADVKINTTITAGTQLDTEKIKEEAAGKRRGEVQDQIKSIQGVTDVEVAYSPFWVTKTPSNKDKITVVIQNEGN